MYKPHNILLTGGAGFIGSHLLIYLVKKYPEYNIVNLDKLDFVSSLKYLEPIQDAPNYKFIKGDILAGDLLAYILKETQIDTILHFACQNHLDDTFGNSLEFTKNNVLGTHVLLEAARAHGVKRFVHVSTDEVYGNQAEEDGADEGTVLEPPNPYAASKAAAEHLVKSYFKSFKLPTIITRSNNVYGPHQHPERLIPKFINLLERGKPCCVHGDGHKMKRYVFVEDVVKAFDIILHHAISGEIYNIGTTFETCPLEVAKKLIKMFGLEKEENQYLQFVPDRPFTEYRYAIDASKLHNLGWTPEISFEEGLQRTIEWYRNHSNIWDNVETSLVPHPKVQSQGNDITNSSSFKFE